MIRTRLAAALGLLLCMCGAFAHAEGGNKPGEWPVYGGDKGNRKYSPLDQINKDNVKNLKPVWQWESADTDARKANPKLADGRMAPFQFESTPLMINGILYESTSYCQVAAINAKTGEQLWAYDPKSWEMGRPTNLGFVNRGVTYWTDGKEERVFIGTGDSRLVSVDAKTGKPDANFGKEGSVDLMQGIRNNDLRRYYASTSPPVICRNIVIVGSSIFDGPTRKEMPPGDVHGFDVRTGELKWTFHTVAQPGEFGAETWEEGSNAYTGNANPWTILAADDELGYFYIPIGTPTNDWYGGHRLGNGLFAESLVCLKAETGERVWHFQMVHHGVWDYDPPAGPILCDINVDGKKIKAVAQVTKQGFTFVFDRTSGQPVWPIEEKAVAPSDVPGEKLSPTQPHPTKPKAFERQGVTEDDVIDFTPELREKALKILHKYKFGPLFTPPSEQGTVQLPGWNGGANWGGAPFDPETGMLYVISTTNPITVQLGQPDPARSNLKYVRQGSLWLAGPEGLPIFKPPYGRITAINMNTGEHAWMAVRGEGPRNHSALKALNLPPLGTQGRGYGFVTKTLLFCGDEGGGRGNEPAVFRAYDKATGAVVAEIPIPGATTGAPVTYMLDGKQFIVIPIGPQKSNGALVALALP